MKKSEVNICDICRRVIANKTCEICDKDICENCEDDMAIGLANGGVLFYIISCKNCSNKLEHGKLKKYFEDEPHTKIRKNMLKVFRNAIIVENLQDNEERTADKKWMLDKIKNDETDFGGGALNPWKTERRPGTETGAFKIVKGGKMKI